MFIVTVSNMISILAASNKPIAAAVHRKKVVAQAWLLVLVGYPDGMRSDVRGVQKFHDFFHLSVADMHFTPTSFTWGNIARMNTQHFLHFTYESWH